MEIWKNIPGYPGYQASSDGNIRSFWTKGKYPKIIDVSTPRKNSVDSFGYQVINITGPTKKQSVQKVHRLVLLAFRGPSSKKYGLHRNDNKSDNRIENLYWGTQKQNLDDQKKNGIHLHGEKCPWARLSLKEVEKIKKQANEGYSNTQQGAMFGVSPSMISMIRNGRRWYAPRNV